MITEKRKGINTMNYNITAEETYMEEMERAEAREELNKWFEEHPEERED